MKAMISYDGLQRVERYFVPKEALREALLNAICHKDYSSGIPIQVSVYKDKLYIANCGHLPENLTVEKLMSKHSSEPYNPHIAHVFYLAGMIENWGRGIEKICEACQTGKSNLPVYTINDRELMVKFSAMSNEWSSDSNDTVNKDLLGSLPSKLPSNIEITYKAICDDPHASNQELAVRTNQSERTIRNHTAKLKEMNFIKRIGSDKTGHWEIVDKGE